jgi:phospholipid/cholesterol/gamma-HCH transport system substrate-binding protein
VIKQTPSPARVLAMAAFALSCVGILIFLWLSFGGSLPLKPQGYRLKVALPEAATLPLEADVRIAGVRVGRVKTKDLQKRPAATLVEVELESRFAPVPKDTRAMLRQKTLFGETFVELTPGHRSAGFLPDGGTLPRAQVAPTVELDEIFGAFDRPTRAAFKQWLGELESVFASSRRRRPSEELNDALGNLDTFTNDGARLFEVLDQQELAVSRLVRNTGVVAEAVTEDEGRLRDLIRNSSATFGATASRHRSLAATFEVFPTFLDESRATLARLERFSRATHPLVRDLEQPARDLAPTVRDLGALAPDLERLFVRLHPLFDASVRGLPAAQRVLRGAGPLVESLHPFFAELNPILAYLSFNQQKVGAFLSNGLTNLVRGTSPTTPWSTQNGIIDSRSFRVWDHRPAHDRGNAYVAPNAYTRAIGLGGVESFTCPGGVEVPTPTDHGEPGGEEAAVPCFVQPRSFFQGQQFPRLTRGRAPVVAPPRDRDGTEPATP